MPEEAKCPRALEKAKTPSSAVLSARAVEPLDGRGDAIDEWCVVVCSPL